MRIEQYEKGKVMTMPSETYFNLNEDKRNRVYNAVFKEYVRVPLEEVSVKNIVNDADIPRGSFYQYFTDKEGALMYLISETSERGHEKVVGFANESQLDIYQLIHAVFCYEIDRLKNREESARALLLNQIVKSARATSIFYRVMAEAMLSHPVIGACWDNMQFKRDDSAFKRNVFDLLFSTLKDALILALEDENNIDSAVSDFEMKMEIVRIGVNCLIGI